MLGAIIFFCVICYWGKRFLQNEDNIAERAHDKWMAEQGYDIKWCMLANGESHKEYKYIKK